MLPEVRPEPPFPVILAGYVVDLHTRDTCPDCCPDGCSNLQEASKRLREWRDRRDKS